MASAVNACEALGSPGVGMPAFQDCGRPKKKGEGGENSWIKSQKLRKYEEGSMGKWLGE